MAKHRENCRLGKFWVAALLVASLTQAQTPPDLKVAEGEYRMRVATGEANLDLRETWTLSQRSDGSYRVESTMQFRIDKERMLLSSIIDFSPGLRPVQWQAAGWVPGMPKKPGTVTVQFDEKAVRWKFGTEQVTQEVEGPYGFFGLPMPWFLSDIAQHAPRDPGKPASLRFVWMDDSIDNPIDLLVAEGTVEFLGTERIKMAGRAWEARKFLVKPGELPSMVVWRSKEGVLLAVEDAKKPEQRMELIRYKEYRALVPLEENR